MNAMSLKGNIKNIAKTKGVSAQVVLQNYFFKRFLDRLSRSEYREKFILKGGLLIAAMTGLDTRSTMDMDTTVYSFPLDEEHIRVAIDTICSVPANDKINFEITDITFIRDDDDYGGFRVSMNAIFETINAPLSIDITTGDVITPKPVKRLFSPLFNTSDQFELWTYNIETILAEKIETILRRSVFNTRPRDFYDVYLISKTQDFNKGIFYKALSATSEHRGTTEKTKNTSEILQAIEESSLLNQYWERYMKEYSYAKDISFKDTIAAVRELLN